MKKYLFVLALPLIFLSTGCNKKKVERLTFQRDSLMAVVSSKEANLNDFVSAFNQIEANLDSIKQKEMIINKTAKAAEVKGNRKEQILSDIAYINSLLEQNRKKVAELTAMLQKSNKHSAELDKMIANLNKSIEEKDTQIASLTADLNKTNAQVKDLNVKVGDLTTSVNNLTAETQQQKQVIAVKTDSLNTAYYVIGTNKELKDKNIITPEGGFIGIGRVKELSANVDMSKLTKVDITKTNEIPIMKKKAKILTTHPQDSYRIEGTNTADKLVILKPEEFWSKSKVLAIAVR